MGGFSSNNPFLQMGAQAVDSYFGGMPVGSAALQVGGALVEQSSRQSTADQDYDFQVEQLRQRQARDIERRRSLLARAEASQRARLGAMGIGSTGGSADALMAGLRQDNADEIGDIQSGYSTRFALLDRQKQREDEAFAKRQREALMGGLQSLGSRSGGGTWSTTMGDYSLL